MFGGQRDGHILIFFAGCVMEKISGPEIIVHYA